MKPRRLWPILSALAVVSLIAIMFILPTGGAASPSLATCRTTHIVEAGQTANVIAAMYGITLDQLIDANNLYNPNHIYAGQQLCIPYVEGNVPAYDGTTGICVTGQVIDKEHNGLGPGIAVRAETGTEIAAATETDASGYFAFKDLTPGTWTFRVSTPDSWEAITPVEFPVKLEYGYGGCYEIRFKVNPLGCIVASKIDASGNPLANWNITATGITDPIGTTDADGNVRFDGLEPGAYVVSEEVQYPWTPITPPEVTVDVHAAMDSNDCTLVSFQNELQPTTCVTGNKVDDNHQGIGGWMIYAQAADGEGPIFMTETAEDGSFTFPNLSVGTWTIWEDQDEFWTPVTPPEFNVTLTEAGDSCVYVRFKNRAPDLCAEGYKVDENGDGVGGWKITATSESDPSLVMTTTTDLNGYYRFNDLTLDNWIFTESHEIGWTTINTDTLKVAVTAGSQCTQVPAFRNRSPHGCVEGYKRDDLQVGLPGWYISLAPAAGGAAIEQVTDGTGYFRFDDLPVGEYRITEQNQFGWSPVSPTTYVVDVVPSDDASCAIVTFVNKQVERDICIDGYKVDANGGVGLPGFVVTATQLSTGNVQTVTTDGLGYFRFSNLEPGSYNVTVAEQEGWEGVGSLSRVVTVEWPAQQTCTTLDFYDQQSAEVTPPDDDNSSGCSAWHTVQWGQTLADISAWYGASIYDVMAINGIANPNLISVGQLLCIP